MDHRTAAPEQTAAGEKPRLIFFHSRSSGRARRIDGFLANVLQRRQNHNTFQLTRVHVEDHPELAARFRVDGIPTLFVVDGNRVLARLADPGGTHEIEELLGPWLQPGRQRRNGSYATEPASTNLPRSMPRAGGPY